MWQIFNYATCHTFKPSLTIVIDDGNQYFKFKNRLKNPHCTMCQILMNG